MTEGLEIISMLAMLLEAICSSPNPERVAGRPSIRIVTLSLPFIDTFPSSSTLTEGTFCNTSTADPPSLTKVCSTLTTLRSRLYSMVRFWPVIVTASNRRASVDMATVPASKWGFAAVSRNTGLTTEPNPMEE